jgi:hypothetical protein
MSASASSSDPMTRGRLNDFRGIEDASSSYYASQHTRDTQATTWSPLSAFQVA